VSNKPFSFWHSHKKKLLFFVGFALCFFWLIYCFYPVIYPEKNPEYLAQKGEVIIYDRFGVKIAHLPLQDGFYIPLTPQEKIPDRLKELLFAIEDKRFETHWGVDFLAKLRAITSNISSNKIVSGGSTITEQWIKNEYFLGKNRTLLQKMRESTLALYFSATTDKDEVLRNYLNALYFGNQIYGLKSASYVYFGTSNVESLSDEEIITLLTLLRNPSTSSSQEKYFSRIFSRICTQAQVSCNPEYSVRFKKFTPLNTFPHVTQKILAENPPQNKTTTVFHSSIDAALQEEVREFMQYQVGILAEKNVSNSAAMAFNPRTGEIIVWQGSVDFFSDEIDGQVNVITQKRQMGSALKPFLYFMAFEDGATPESLLIDVEQDFSQSIFENTGDVYHPLNYSLSEEGIVPMREALANSLNISAVKILHHIGGENFLAFLQELGIYFDYDFSHYGLSLALGSPDITMEEVARAYANMMKSPEDFSGKNITLQMLKPDIPSVKKQDGNKVFTQSQQYLWDTLSSQINRRKSFGLNSILNTTVPMMVKTGTTHNFRDNWVFAYHPDLIIAVWVGNNDSSEMKGVSGVTGAGSIFHFIAEEAEKKNYFVSTVSSMALQDAEEKNYYCIDDFYIKDISDAEQEKIQKLFGETVLFDEEECKNIPDQTLEIAFEKNEKKAPEIKILSPQNGEIFYVNPEVSRELQKIIFKASVSENIWVLDGKKIQEKPQSDSLFWLPKIGKHELSLQNNSGEKIGASVFFEVKTPE
jgi:penicillin-binding protein 1C